jgi:nucleoside-diphosphate-sugar epimerase
VHTEDDGYQPLPPVARRYASDQETIAAAADECDFASIAEAIAALLAIPVRAFTDFDEAVSVLGAPLWAHGLACNSRVDSTKARIELGWSPQGPGLMDDLRYGSYRRVWSIRSVTVVTE